MSYNIDSVRILSKSDDFGITEERFNEIDPDADFLPEGWEDYEELIELVGRGSFPWYGEGSGGGFENLLTDVLPKFSGSADMLVCWEGGDSQTGIRVKDGVATEHDVVMSLGERT